jgi:hypothetical protein
MRTPLVTLSTTSCCGTAREAELEALRCRVESLEQRCAEGDEELKTVEAPTVHDCAMDAQLSSLWDQTRDDFKAALRRACAELRGAHRERSPG